MDTFKIRIVLLVFSTVALMAEVLPDILLLREALGP
jgi:hypothetical protein